MDIGKIDFNKYMVNSLAAALTPTEKPEISDDVLAILNGEDEEANALYEESQKAARRKLIETAAVNDLNRKIAESLRPKWNNPSLADLPPLVPEDDDPTVLFENNFLAQGQSFALVGSSGTGKSSMIMQAMYHWAVGLPFLANPKRPLKIAYIQTEDSDRDVKEQIAGMRRGLADEVWEPEQIAAAERNIFIPGDFIGLQGDEFTAQLRRYQQDIKADMLILNPLQGVFGGDLSDQEAVSHFCRAGIDPIIKDPKHPAVCGVVMHTPKQKSGAKEGRASVDDYAEYAMSGSQEWTAWCRAVFTFLKHKNCANAVEMVCPKRGNRLEWRKLWFKFADGFIYWVKTTEAELAAEAAAQAAAEASQTADGEAAEKEDGRRKKPLDIDRAAASCVANYSDDLDGATRKEWASSMWNRTGRNHPLGDWMRVFDRIVEMIKEGQIDTFKTEKTIGRNGKIYLVIRSV